MKELTEVIEIIKELCTDKSIPKNVRSVLTDIEELLLDDHKEIAMKVDSASQMIGEISLDPNLSSFARTQIWELSSILEDLNGE
ncbi:hypothetical protein HOD83_00780 [Candidatus Woesearchaeota archaeon]|jgi:uncharacterized protein (UPF0147 family)|nr:hypothetical protein [Candidatus Woesearchaeota archaeon]MBT4114035.1 hypothetical protein [Candidatus Woesearchaeota archaeon]MBT4248108.1 hypothetical protein [Candidatus Woesearchaeota archaeon]